MTKRSSNVRAKLAPLFPPLAAHEYAEERLSIYDRSISKTVGEPEAGSPVLSFEPATGDKKASRTA